MRRNSKEYLEGYNSGYARKSLTDNPYCYYSKENYYADWLDGYYQGYYDANLGIKGERNG